MYDIGDRVFHFRLGYGVVKHTYHSDGELTNINVEFNGGRVNETFYMPKRVAYTPSVLPQLFIVDDELEEIIEKLRRHA